MQCAVCERELEAFTGDVCPHCQHFAHPTRLGIYDGLELIKRGGMGSVYRARTRNGGRDQDGAHAHRA